MENTNVIMLNEENLETTEETVNTDSDNGLLIGAGIGCLVTLGCMLTHKCVIKPLIAKIKARKEQQAEDDGSEDDFIYDNCAEFEEDDR